MTFAHSSRNACDSSLPKVPFGHLCAVYNQFTMPESGGVMSGNVRSGVNVLVSVALLGIISVTQASASSEKTVNNQQHHSRISKAAIWRHHKHKSETAKASPAAPQKTQAQKAQPKTAQLKQVSAKTATGAQNPKQASQTKVSKPSTAKTSAATNTKPSQKAHDGQTSSVKQ